MDKIKSISRKSCCLVLFLMLFTIIVAGFSEPAMATSGGYFTGETVEGDTYDLNEFGSAIESFYKIAVAIALPLGALSLAFAAFRMLTGNDDDVSKGRRQLFITVVALIALFILPQFIKMGVDIGRTNGWSPKIGDASSLETTYHDGNSFYSDSDSDSDSENKDEDKKADEDK